MKHRQQRSREVAEWQDTARAKDLIKNKLKRENDEKYSKRGAL